LNKDARDIETLVDQVYEKNYKLAGQGFWLPVAAVEMSLWDLLGHASGKTVSGLMGGARMKAVPIYLSGSGREATAEEEVDVYVRGVQETGAKAVKFKIGGRMSRNADATPNRTDKMLALARKASANVNLYATPTVPMTSAAPSKSAASSNRSTSSFSRNPAPGNRSNGPRPSPAP